MAIRKEQEALRDVENRFQAMVNSMPQLGWIARPDGYITWYNDRWYEYTGTTPEQMEGWGWQVVHDAVELPKTLQRWKESIAKGSPIEMSFTIRGADGNFRMFLTRVFPLKDAAGCVVQWFGTNTDVEEQTRAEKLLRESENNYRTLFESMQDGYAQCKLLRENGVPKDFIIINVNDQVEKLTGLKNIVGKTIREIIPGIRISNPELFETCTRVALTGQPEKLETHLESLRIWLALAVYSNGEDQIVIVFQNVTERKINEQELIILNNHLSSEVDKRTSELSELTAHIQEISETEKANMARELHDELGGTLGAINMRIKLLSMGTTDPDRLKDLTIIKDLVAEASRAKNRVINQLFPTILEDCGFTPAIEWLVGEYRQNSALSVELLMPKENIVMDPSYALAAYRITQECLTNIAKHAEASKVQIEANTNNGFLNLIIHDNGKGMPGEISINRHGIFGMKERARYLGGSLKIGSVPEKGTTAELHLPLSVAKPNNVKRVLIVDDHAIVRDALRQLLIEEADDFLVEGEAADGKVALQMAIEEEWDIILLDLSLPKMNGMQVLDAIRLVKPKQPIIILSSSPESEHGAIARSKGAASYIEKGETERLVAEMRRAISQTDTPLTAV